MDYKLRNICRIKKKQGEQIHKNYNQRYVAWPPPRSELKGLTSTAIYKFSQKYGYNYEAPQYELDPFLKQAKQTFEGKAEKYFGSRTMVKKQTRFDKMRIKEELGFKMQEMPVRKQFRRADLIITRLMKRQALLAIMECR